MSAFELFLQPPDAPCAFGHSAAAPATGNLVLLKGHTEITRPICETCIARLYSEAVRLLIDRDPERARPAACAFCRSRGPGGRDGYDLAFELGGVTRQICARCLEDLRRATAVDFRGV
jgi:hypothetical protein